MRLNDLYPFVEERKTRRRVGRGSGSGLGGTSGKGHKGQNARAGGGVRPGFEVGQHPLIRRIPKRGFNNRFRKVYTQINVSALEGFDNGTTVTPEMLVAAGLVRKVEKDGIKILGNGELTKSLTVKAAGFTSTAQAKIEANGGKAEVIE